MMAAVVVMEDWELKIRRNRIQTDLETNDSNNQVGE